MAKTTIKYVGPALSVDVPTVGIVDRDATFQVASELGDELLHQGCEPRRDKRGDVVDWIPVAPVFKKSKTKPATGGGT